MSLRQSFVEGAMCAILLCVPMFVGQARGDDCNHNTIADNCDIQCGDVGGPCHVEGCGQSADCNADGVPDECQARGRLIGAGLSDVYEIDMVTGAASRLSGFGLRAYSELREVEIEPKAQVLIGVGPGGLLSIDTATGEITVIGPLPEPHYVRLLAFDAQTNSFFAIQGTGTLIAVDWISREITEIGDVGYFINDLAFDATARLLFGVTRYAGLVQIDLATGSGAMVGPLTVEGELFVEALAFDPTDNILYGAGEDWEHETSDLLAIDRTTGTTTRLGRIGPFIIQALTFDTKTGMLYGKDEVSSQIIRIDPYNGQGVPLFPLGFPRVESMAYDGNTDTLYGVNTPSDHLVTVDMDKGTATPVGRLDYADIAGLAFVATRNVLLAADADTDQLLEIDPLTAECTPLGPLGFSNVRGLTYDPNAGRLYGADRDTQGLIRIDQATGAGTPVGPIGFDLVEGLAFDAKTDTLYGVDSWKRRLIVIDQETGKGHAVLDLGLTQLRGLTFNTKSRRFYTQSAALISVDLAGRTVSAVGTYGMYGIRGMAFDPNTNTLYGVETSDRRLVKVNPLTGEGTFLGRLSHSIIAAAFDPYTNTLYGAVTDTIEPDWLVSIDVTTAEESIIGPMSRVWGMAFDPNSRTLYGTTASTWPSDYNRLLVIDPLTGASTQAPEPLGFHRVDGLTFDPQTNTLYATDEEAANQLLTVDTTTGRASAIGQTVQGYIRGLQFIPGDCNGNGVPDDCDIASQTSDDCGGNGRPDECEPDADSDGIPDLCDQFGDSDHDADTDLEDYATFRTCLDDSGPRRPPLVPGCLDAFDKDGSGTVDLLDSAAFQLVFRPPR